MKVLLDENLPHHLREVLHHHEVFTVAYLGWQGIKNGELLKRAETESFEVFVTADQNMQYQQNLEARQIALVVLTAQHWELISPHLPEIAAAVDRSTLRSYRMIHCGRFNRSGS